MANSERIPVPKDWEQIQTQLAPVEEGRWRVVISRAEVANKELRIHFEIRDEGAFFRRLLYRVYSTETPRHSKTMKELYEAAGVPVNGPEFEHEKLVGRELDVQVLQNAGRDGRCFANVVRHWRKPKSA